MFATSAATRSQFSSIARISGPLIINFLAVAGMNLADVMMSGRLGADARGVLRGLRLDARRLGLGLGK